MSEISRTPPVEILRQLRKQVGFGCPVPGCASPYLMWHHFDPPWNEQQHHNPNGMIALCVEHHPKADAGAFTKAQLREFKVRAAREAHEVGGRFDWLRRTLLGIVGGNFYYETRILVQFRRQPLVWFTRDIEGYLLLNVNMLSTSGQPRLRIEENFWLLRDKPEDLVCPPSGRILRCNYLNGDALGVEFFTLDSEAAIEARYAGAKPGKWNLAFPLTAVEVTMRVGQSEIDFSARETRLPRGSTLRGNFAGHTRVGLTIR
jgi:hypothetical protein